ncbi:glutamine synthetase [Dehalococcoidia bacterium]|nr:glutamine synthetase [Dehalococcoidia bacterium]
MRRELDPGKPNLDNMYELGLDEIKRRGIQTLPQNLNEALSELRKDEVVQSGLGVIYDEFINLKESEWNDYHSQVSEWELNRYLTFF